MDRFVSNFTNRLDSKGRVSIPAPFRGVLGLDGFDGLYVHPSLHAQALDCGGNALMREIDAMLGRFVTYTEEHDIFSTALLGTSEILKVDPEGRVILTDSLKNYAGITKEVTFVGHGHKFQIWEPGRFQTHLEEARNQLRELRRQLGARQAGEDTGGAAGGNEPLPRGVQE
ncbi:MAG: division/cell wall cluster transcriptional repressor MraZ [Hyphomicrobiales bacterium]|nr:division/cell wall cluster transcriptional repressor MraZ [Hyphomicrobiales bacterium]